MTLKEALESGYNPYTVSWTRGYLSRRVNIDEQPVQQRTVCGAPCFISTRYHYKVYLAK